MKVVDQNTAATEVRPELNAFRLARHLLSIRRLFISLLLMPVVIGLGIVFVQTIASVTYLKLINEHSNEYGRRLSTSQASAFLRRFLYGTAETGAKVTICRWADGMPAGEGCAIAPIDIVLRVQNPADFDPSAIVDTFEGATRRIHLCRDCDSEFRITLTGDGAQTRISSFAALAVLALADSERFVDLSRHLVKAHAEWDQIEEIRGEVEFAPPGLSAPIMFSDARNIMVLVLNASLIAAIVLWLALRSHRRVLDYFAKNDVLLPLIASCGKRTVYHSLWVLTLVRVIAFLLTALVPLLFVMSALRDVSSKPLIAASAPALLLWGVTVFLGLSAMGTIVSIGELKQRYPFASLMHKVLPFVAWLGGSVLWFVAILEGGSSWQTIAKTVELLPVIGLTPVLIAPMGALSVGMLACHSVIACLLAWHALRYNAQWFGAHVEEV